ncbi:MAG: LytR/AlgR family response regulator transcription factor [Nitrososphaeraceae archaeon]
MKDFDQIITLIVDDESNSRNVLRKLLQAEHDIIKVVDVAADVEEAFMKIQAYKPQLVFLDIQMPTSNGFNLLRKFESVPFEVIFVTSFDKYAINAIKFSALDYLLKPIELPDLKMAIDKAVKAIEDKENKNALVINLLHNLETDITDRKIAVHSNDKVKMISELQINYIEGERRYSNIYTANGETYLTAKYLKNFEEYFSENSSFIRINKSFIINVRHIKHYTKGDPFIVEMVDGKVFEVSRRKKTEVLEKIKSTQK